MREELSQGYVSCLKVRGGGEKLSRVERYREGVVALMADKWMQRQGVMVGSVWWAKYEVVKVRDGQEEWCARLDGLS